MNIEICKNCGFPNFYVQIFKKGVEKRCLPCFIREKKTYGFEVVDVKFENLTITCRTCNRLFIHNKSNPIPPFFCNKDHTFYCGCKDITYTLQSNNITEFVEFMLNPETRKN